MLTIYVNGARVDAESVQYTCVDSGGFETCGFTVVNPLKPIGPGYKILILSGLEIAWQGFVEEPGFQENGGLVSYNVTGVGAGILLKRKTYSCIYIDRDLNRWQGISSSRQNVIINGGFTFESHQVLPDTSSGAPCISTNVTGSWTLTSLPISEAWYDAGAGNKISTIFGIWTRGSTVNSADANWFWGVYLLTDDAGSASQTTGNLRAAGPATFSVDATQNLYRYGMIEQYYATGPSGGDNTTYAIQWSAIRVIGDHGLAIRDLPGLDGIYCTDIAQHAFEQAGSDLVIGEIGPSTTATIHSAYYEPITPEQVIDDMAVFLGWHWGVWEGESIFDTTPRFFFVPPPTQPNISVDYTDCEQFDITERFSQLHNKATLQWHDAAGRSGTAEVEKPNSRLPYGVSQELLLGAGVMAVDEAEAMASTLLAIDQLESRFAGSAVLPTVVDTKLGKKDAHLIKPGRDRIQILGTPKNTTQIGEPIERVDSFRVSRISVSVDNGAIRTQIEFDTGASLLDALNSRLEVAQTLAGG